ncbi:MAG: DUF4254 domain-containing protein [Elusimicrobia bacterium]|nr:DUF4254 domain-containing protein [Elusimicrobiota bacterium]
MAETIGWLVDKITISELKIYHTREQLERTDVGPEHKELCRRRLEVLRRQNDDLKEELGALYADVVGGKVQLKIYRQFKMYNDPRFFIKKDAKPQKTV